MIRNGLFFTLALVWLGLYWRRLYTLAGLALRSDAYSHILVIPLVSVAVIYWRRKRIFSEARFDVPFALSFFCVGAFTCWFRLNYLAILSPSSELSLSILSFVIYIVGSFALCYGSQALLVAAFPLLFSLLMVPIPAFALEKIIAALQHWSADGSSIIFNVLGIPVHREGLVFDLPGVSIIVAEECSGIRSTLALLITVLVAAQLSLKSNWRKLILLILVVPIAVAKNSIRIVTVTLLTTYVNRGFLDGRLHRNGGVLFFLLGFAVSMGFLKVLELWEQKVQCSSTLLENNSNNTLPETSSIR